MALTFDNGYILCGRDYCHRTLRPPILERSILHIQNPTARGIDRWDDRSISDRNYTLSRSELAGCPESDVAASRYPLKHDNSFKCTIIRIAAVYLELVRLYGDLIFPRRSYLFDLDKLYVWIRVIDPDRGRATAFTCLFDTQRRLVVFRVCGAYLQNGRGRLKSSFVRCDRTCSHR